MYQPLVCIWLVETVSRAQDSFLYLWASFLIASPHLIHSGFNLIHYSFSKGKT